MGVISYPGTHKIATAAVCRCRTDVFLFDDNEIRFVSRADNIRPYNDKNGRYFTATDDIRPYDENGGIRREGDDCMELPRRKPIRLQGFDYSSGGAYFVTVCANDRYPFLWLPAGTGYDCSEGADHLCYDVSPGQPPPLSEYGRIAETAINHIPTIYPYVEIDKYCIMPDHIHMIAFILPRGQTANISVAARELSTIVGQMKRWVSKQVGFSLWQKSFYDHIIRDETGYNEVWKYIDENPLKYQR